MLHQRYLIIGQAGRGGMGAVYQAVDTHIVQRQVAIKEMGQSALSKDQMAVAMARFQQEAAILGSLSHPNLPHIYDAFSEQERTYFVMDYIDGKTLYQMLKEGQQQPMPVSQALHYALQLCDVLTYLHQQTPPIIFRDVKPTNIMVTQTGQIFLIDFGIARFFKEGQEQDTEFLGSRGYASPEQHGIFQTNPRTDIYGLGATLHFCLTGRDPYHAEDRFAFPPVRQYNPQVPIEFDQLIQRLLALDEQQRPASAIEVQQALTKIRQQATEDTRAISPTLPPTPLPQVSPSPALAATQYSRPAPPSNQGPPTAATVPSALPVYGGRSLVAPPAVGRTPIFARIWTPSFSILFGLLFVVTVGISTYVFSSVCSSDHTVESGLTVVLLLIALFTGTTTRGRVPRSILLLTGLAALLSSIVLIYQAILDIPNLVIPLTTCPIPREQLLILLNPSLTIGLAAAAVISLFWFSRPFAMTDRFILGVIFGVAAIFALIQFLYLDQDLLKHMLLLIAMITLILGTLMAAQMERVRAAASGT